MKDVLPGVHGPETSRPSRICAAAEIVRKARRRAIMQDVFDLFLLAGVDFIFLWWRDARLPFATRHSTVILLALFHVAMLGWFFLIRKLPVWRAKIVAGTWSRHEKAHLQAVVGSGRRNQNSR